MGTMGSISSGFREYALLVTQIVLPMIMANVITIATIKPVVKISSPYLPYSPLIIADLSNYKRATICQSREFHQNSRKFPIG